MPLIGGQHRCQVVSIFCGTFLPLKMKGGCGQEGHSEMQATDGEELLLEQDQQ